LKLTVGVDASVVASSSGGTRTYALLLLEHLVQIRPAWSFVLYLRHSGEGSSLGDLARATNAHTSVVGGSPNVWRIQAALPRHLDRDGVDVYHSLGFFLPLRWRGPKLVTVHDLNVYAHARRWMRGPTILRWMDLAIETSFSIHVADRVITDSESSREQIRKYMHVGPEKVRVIPLAADPFFFAEPSMPELDQVKKLTGGHQFVLFVGILSPMKNLITLLRAYASSRLPAMDVRLLLAGSDREAYTATLREQARSLGIDGLVDMPGFVEPQVLRALYHSALGLVLPSHGEGFGLPLVEAMAAGSPILAANRQSIPEVLGDAGRLFEPDDVAGLATLLTRLGEDGAFREELARNALAGRDRFSWSATAEATAAVYEEVVASKRR
jgi:glycosyltransferase involved in cell wall biosynthesis